MLVCCVFLLFVRFFVCVSVSFSFGGIGASAIVRHTLTYPQRKKASWKLCCGLRFAVWGCRYLLGPVCSGVRSQWCFRLWFRLQPHKKKCRQCNNSSHTIPQPCFKACCFFPDSLLFPFFSREKLCQVRKAPSMICLGSISKFRPHENLQRSQPFMQNGSAHVRKLSVPCFDFHGMTKIPARASS